VTCVKPTSLEHDNDAVLVIKKPNPVSVVFARNKGVINSIEGTVHYHLGDAILTGIKGEKWAIQRNKFEQSYYSESNVFGEDGFYVKKLVAVLAKRIDKVLTVLVGWHAEPLNGKPGDWLLQYGKNDFGIVQNDIFIETYEKADISSTD